MALTWRSAAGGGAVAIAGVVAWMGVADAPTGSDPHQMGRIAPMPFSASVRPIEQPTAVLPLPGDGRGPQVVARWPEPHVNALPGQPQGQPMAQRAAPAAGPDRPQQAALDPVQGGAAGAARIINRPPDLQRLPQPGAPPPAAAQPQMPAEPAGPNETIVAKRQPPPGAGPRPNRQAATRPDVMAKAEPAAGRRGQRSAAANRPARDVGTAREPQRQTGVRVLVNAGAGRSRGDASIYSFTAPAPRAQPAARIRVESNAVRVRAPYTSVDVRW